MSLPDDPRELDRVASAFRGLTHPTRLQILDALRHEAVLSPRQLLGRVSPPTGLANVAYHTRELASLGLLSRAGERPVRGALEHFYRLSPHGRALIDVAEQVVTEDSAM
jgi:DNA-binding transcriptional ArsR family regulator